MAFPTVQARNNSKESADTGTHTVNLPAGVQSGELLIIAITVDGNRTFTWPSGWTAITGLPSGAVSNTITARYKIADGTEGSTAVLTEDGGNSDQSVHRSWRISGHSASTSPPEVAVATGTSTTPTSPTLNPAGWGTEDTLWIVFTGVDSESRTFSAFPTNYTNTFSDNTTTSGGQSAGAAERQLNAASESPGGFTINTSTAWRAFTLAVRPGAEGVSGGATVTPGVISVAATLPAASGAAQVNATTTPGVIATTALVSSGAGVSAGAGPSAIANVVAIPQAMPATGSGEVPVFPGVIETEVSLPQATVTQAVAGFESPIANVVTFPQAIVVAPVTVTPGVISVVTTMPAAALTATSTPIPAAIGVVATVPQAGLRITVIRYTVTSPIYRDWTFGKTARPKDKDYWDRYGAQPSGKTLIRNSGTWEAVTYPSTTDINAADDIYDENGALRKAVLFGGHESRVSQGIADELDAQGFGAFISESEELVA